MFRNEFQSGYLSVLYSLGTKPLQIWDKKVKNGHIKRISDTNIQSMVLELQGIDIKCTSIVCPAVPKPLGIKLPFLTFIVKNMKKPFSFEIQILDSRNTRRRFRCSTFQRKTRIKPYICTMPLRLQDGWNQLQLNLPEFTRKAYSTAYIETLQIQVHANCRLRRIFFSDKLYAEDDLPTEFKLYKPVTKFLKVLENTDHGHRIQEGKTDGMGSKNSTTNFPTPFFTTKVDSVIIIQADSSREFQPPLPSAPPPPPPPPI